MEFYRIISIILNGQLSMLDKWFFKLINWNYFNCTYRAIIYSNGSNEIVIISKPFKDHWYCYILSKRQLVTVLGMVENHYRHEVMSTISPGTMHYVVYIFVIHMYIALTNWYILTPGVLNIYLDAHWRLSINFTNIFLDAHWRLSINFTNVTKGRCSFWLLAPK